MKLRHFGLLGRVAALAAALIIPLTAYAAETTKEIRPLELTGVVVNESNEATVVQPSVAKNSDGIWVLTATENTTTVLYHENISIGYSIKVVDSNGVGSGNVNSDGNLEIYTNGAGTGDVSFQLASNKDGSLVGSPLSIAILSTERLSEDEVVENYYSESVICGDSIILGLRNYAMKNTSSFLSKATYLCAGSYSLRYALIPDNPENLHPTYQGQKRVLWESISMIQPKRVFLFFGLNDLNVSGLEGARDNYIKLVNQIKEVNPDVEIHIISMTMTLEGTGKGNLKNDRIREFNDMMQATCKEQGWGYVDLASAVVDSKGNLKKEYCSDGFVHHSTSCYSTAWTQVMRDYALASGNKAANSNSANTDDTNTDLGENK